MTGLTTILTLGLVNHTRKVKVRKEKRSDGSKTIERETSDSTTFDRE